jgi:hypothetical protein
MDFTVPVPRGYWAVFVRTSVRPVPTKEGHAGRLNAARDALWVGGSLIRKQLGIKP